MAQQFVTDTGALIIPGAYPQITFAPSNGGLSATGVLALVGEAFSGPDFSLEPSLNDNSFGPGQQAQVVAKYGSGPLVDAFKSAIAAANDPNIQGSFSRAVLVKTNVSLRSSGSLLKYDASAWATIQARAFGKNGNLISSVVTSKQAEVVPTTGPFAFLPAINSTNISVRVNGGAASPITIGAAGLPSVLVTALDAVTGLDASGGVDRAILATITGTLALTVISGNAVQIDRSVPYSAATTLPGDSLFIPVASALAVGTTTNAGSYIVTSATASTIFARKLLNASGSPTVVTAPANKTATASIATTDVRTFSPVIVVVAAANPIPGTGKTLEISELTTGTDLLSYLCYTLETAGPTASTWISSVARPFVIASGTEYIAKVTSARQIDNVTEDISAGGGIALKLGYAGTSASVVNDGTTLTITVVGGAGTSPAPITLTDFPSVADLASYIGSLPGFSAAPGTAVLGSQPSVSLDRGTFTFATTFGSYGGRIKQDGYKLFNKFATDSVLVQLSAQPTSGQPAPQAISFLVGGAKGSTSDVSFNAAIDALQKTRVNFVVPLFSRNATGDIVDALTDTASTYTIANMHSYVRAHVAAMSTRKRRRNRQAFLSIRDTFSTAKETAANVASARCSMTFQDVKDVSSVGGIVQFQPWMGALKAAAMQAAGFYRAIVHKGIAISGALQAARDFDDQDDANEEDALVAGLLPIKQDETGGFFWVSDQTTYGKDNSFALNSIQVMYAADIIALTVSSRMEAAFVGQSIADASASLALITLDSILEDVKRLRLIAPSNDAPKGYKNESIQINGPTMSVRFEVKVSGAIYFIPIDVLVSQVSQSA